MSKLLQSTTKRSFRLQRIPWANFDKSSSARGNLCSTSLWATRTTTTTGLTTATRIFQRRQQQQQQHNTVVSCSPPPPTSTSTSASLSTPAQQTIPRQGIVAVVVTAQPPISRQYHTLRSPSVGCCQLIPQPVSVSSNRTRFYSQTFHKYQSIMDVPEGVFRGSLDRFNGITVDSSAEYETDGDFPEKLKTSLEFWEKNKRRGIWFKVQTEHSDWIPHLTKQQFDFHHAKNGFVVMYRWLPKDEYANIPDYAHTMVGVGGLVVNDETNEVLVVSERYALIPNSWKLPGGYVEPRENLVDGAIREVREETGIDCKFKTVVSVRHSHGGGFGCSDIYVVVGLTPQNLELQRCEREIAKIQWMPIDEYLQHPNVHETNRHFLRTFLDYDKRGIRFTCEVGRHQILKKEYCLYFMQMLHEEDQQKTDKKKNSNDFSC